MRPKALVLRGRCQPQESVPYKAFDALVDALSRALAALSDAEAGALAPSNPGALLRLFPVLEQVPALAEGAKGAPPQPIEPQELRRQGFEALCDLLTRLGRSRLLVLWIDDLQWGDPDSALLLRELLRSAAPLPLLLLLSYRSEDAVRSPILRALEESTAGLPAGVAREIVVAPLDGASARALTAQHLAACPHISPEQLDQIAAEAGGSPLFIGELARDLAGMATASGPGAASGATVHFNGVVARRIARLSGEERRVLEIVSVAGAPIARSVALRAAGLSEAARPKMARLGQACLLRATWLDGGPAVEPFHDRIREAVMALLSVGAQRGWHGALAEVLEDDPSTEPETLLRHWLGAGQPERALSYAVRAAERAAASLAFARAAELYERARALCTGDAALAAKLRLRQADALVDAGHGTRAAPLYLAAAADRLDGAAIELRRRAAEQLLISGHMDRGTEVLRELLGAVRLDYPATPALALLSIVARMAHLRVRGLGFRARDDDALRERDRLRIDLCQAAAKGLVAVDSVRGGHFSFLSLLLALEAGEPVRVGRSLALVGGAVLVPAGGPMERWGLRMLDEARAIAEQRNDPHLLGTVLVATGQAHIFRGSWREARAACDAGIACLRAHCRGIAWESNIGHMGALRAAEELGRFPEFASRVQAFLSEAEGRGDVYAQVTARLYDSVARLIADDADGARAQAREALGMWSQEGFHVQHLYALRVEVFSDLVEGRAEAGWRRVEAAWPALSRSLLLRVPITRIDAALMRARSALAVASAQHRHRRAMLRICEQHAAGLSREPRPDAAAHAALLRAGVAAARGERRAALAQLDRAADGYARAGMEFHAACAGHRKGELLGGDEGARLQRAAAEEMRARAVRSPERWMAVHAPGSWR